MIASIVHESNSLGKAYMVVCMGGLGTTSRPEPEVIVFLLFSERPNAVGIYLHFFSASSCLKRNFAEFLPSVQSFELVFIFLAMLVE